MKYEFQVIMQFLIEIETCQSDNQALKLRIVNLQKIFAKEEKTIQSDSESISEVITAIFNTKRTSIEQFNRLTLKSQQIMLNEKVSESYPYELNPIYERINSLSKYVMKVDRDQKILGLKYFKRSN